MRTPSLSFASYRHRGFTLIELMIVVLILGILAGIVAASMSSPAEQTREATLKGQLRAMRSQVLLYKLQHGDVLPSGATFADALTRRSDLSGALSPDGNSQDYPFGPYVLAIPANPYNGRSDVIEVPAGSAITPNDNSGWIYQIDGAGGFIFTANTSRNDSSGKPLSEY